MGRRGGEGWRGGVGRGGRGGEVLSVVYLKEGGREEGRGY